MVVYLPTFTAYNWIRYRFRVIILHYTTTSLEVSRGFLLTSKCSAGRSLPAASSSPRHLPNSGFYIPAPDLYCPNTARTKSMHAETGHAV